MDEFVESVLAALRNHGIDAELGDGEWPIVVSTADATYGINIEGVECL